MKTTKWTRLASVAAVTCAAAVCSAGCEVSDEPHLEVIPSDGSVAGRTMSDWTRQWWRWLVAIPSDRNSLGGGACSEAQAGPVWFLAGSGGEGPVERTCTIPEGLHVLMPILNVIDAPCWEDACDIPDTTDELVADAAAVIENVTRLDASLDGVHAADPFSLRVGAIDLAATPPADETRAVFVCLGPVGENACGVEVGSARPMVSDGWWVMLPPPDRGAHRLHVYAELRDPEFPESPAFVQDVTYLLTIE